MTLMGLKRDVDDLKREVNSRRPSLSVGVLTNHTTRGTTRTVLQNPGNQQTTTTTTTSTPRWA